MPPKMEQGSTIPISGTAQNGTVFPLKGYRKSVIMSLPTKR
uniref:Uncharacterized protein n=1 Tax=Arundo donax TaxID=35708 RepID=A0A0A9GRC4_ARUDO